MPALALIFHIVRLADGTANGQVSREATEQAIASVSYTHLRAHETVLDLVCRLLLEKKNPQTPDPTSSAYRSAYRK